ncbi:uncharacterized protein LOC127851134 [Dreissena polymorpha]|uniref:Uncharacterized protein n=1 Tax=Dreissena polymorpha TaxID=45954 RepID=A0A9D4D6K1_DREPO|nr:uncharacterized protein LOC127851134 [Dreissena polymorpha]XP_052240657.1 uncharacterized protein LOC127851134 [Dreissena polymorpha]XP_052240658.1 uncharacterized protein LOC127851134 [Dreissena polymorpha]XP_052240660.1 uncharacterized protein LOC127851134 [Dreissena polymorpha]XP_052240661.1 uncharacterized protein LOC127851134 [Dreissena polymorpha]XP_052240662.1 uncharacterized protein LOC127851134 [Dreissena polymorpha]XP_052240663.1 uncharacterized protein LOC127851134 [Dreissena po
MPSLQSISYNSSRVQRAYRINNIENLRLQNRIQLLEKERLHTQRLTNQDIRLISLTLDYIQTHSGHSAEGLPPQGEKVHEEEQKDDEGPTFLYGERIVSRKKRRNLRPQSALDKSSTSRYNSETASIVSTAEINTRPQSSPIRRTTFVTHLRDRDDESVFGSASESSTSSSSVVYARFKPAWTEEPMPEVTKILLRAASEHNQRESVFSRHNLLNGTRGTAALKSLTRSLKMSSQSGLQNQMPVRSAEGDKISRGNSPVRGARITDIINRGPKATMSANAWKAHLNYSQSGPQNISAQRQYIMDTKKEMNEERTKMIEKKVKKFVSKSSQLQ